MADFTHIESWVFDLDNTLYPCESNLFSQIHARMAKFIMARFGLAEGAAQAMRKRYYVQYGTTLSGLMAEHDVAPQDYLDYVHDIDLDALAPAPALAARLAHLPGRRFVFTNGSMQHAENVMTRLGVADLFDEIFDIAAADYLSKPHRAAYECFIDRHRLAPQRAAMFEDLPQNLEAPHALGMTTVLVRSPAPQPEGASVEKLPAHPEKMCEHIHYIADCLVSFLGEVRTSAPVDGAGGTIRLDRKT